MNLSWRQILLVMAVVIFVSYFAQASVHTQEGLGGTVLFEGVRKAAPLGTAALTGGNPLAVAAVSSGVDMMQKPIESVGDAALGMIGL